MTFFPFRFSKRHPSGAEAQLAAQLRALAAHVEEGDVRQLVVTVIRQDGRIERMGVSPDSFRKP